MSVAPTSSSQTRCSESRGGVALASVSALDAGLSVPGGHPYRAVHAVQIVIGPAIRIRMDDHVNALSVGRGRGSASVGAGESANVHQPSAAASIRGALRICIRRAAPHR